MVDCLITSSNALSPDEMEDYHVNRDCVHKKERNTRKWYLMLSQFTEKDRKQTIAESKERISVWTLGFRLRVVHP